MPTPLVLTVVSYPSHLERLFEQLALHYARSTGPGFAVERCQDPDDLLYLARVWKNRGRAIIRLDLHGHGDGGRFKMGDRLAFASDGTGYRLARQLGPKLAPDAVVRLLGCRTAIRNADPRLSGPKLLRDLQGLLGSRRRVLGTTDYLRLHHCSPTGLTEAGERLLRGVKPAR